MRTRLTLSLFAATTALFGPVRAQDDAPETSAPETTAPNAAAPGGGTSPAAPASPFPAAPTGLPTTQENRGVRLTLRAPQLETLPNPKIRNVILPFGFESAASDAQPAPGRTLESYARSPLWYDEAGQAHPGKTGRVAGQPVLVFRALPTAQTHLKMRVSFLDPGAKVAGQDLNRVSSVSFAGVPIPRVLNESVPTNRTFQGEHGVVVTLQSATLRVKSEPDAPRDESKREVVLALHVQQPAPRPGEKSTARLEYIDGDWNSLVFARDDKGVEWAHDKVTLGSPSDFFSDGDWSFSFPEAASPGASTFEVRFGLREIVKHPLPASAFRRFFFDVDLGAPQQAAAG